MSSSRSTVLVAAGLTLAVVGGAALSGCVASECKCAVPPPDGAVTGAAGAAGAVGAGGMAGGASGAAGAAGGTNGAGGIAGGAAGKIGSAGAAGGTNGAGGIAGGAGGAAGALGGRGGSGANRDGGAGTGGAGTGGGGNRDAGASTDAPTTISTDGGTWRLVWSDEFDVDGAPNPSSWGFEKGFVRNQELQWYQPDNATVANGILTIAAQKVHILNPNYQAGSSDWKTNRQYYDYTSTSMTTSGKHAWMYGRFEMRARIDTRQGAWPAFWILGSGTAWPQSGEVDIMEYYANKVLANVCTPSGSNCNWDSTNQSLSSLGSSWSSAFHVWAMEWDAQKIDLYLDDKLVNTYNVSTAGSGSSNPYSSKTFYVLVNLALGGTNGGDPSSTTFPITYEVDYVRVYQH
jgi:beta-glucanase (GH16 family)